MKIEDHGEWTNVRVENPDFRWQHQQRRQNQECIVSTKNKFEVLSKLEYAPDDNDETEAPRSKKRPWLTVVRSNA